MKKWKCTVCGQSFEGDTPPVPCPVCSAGEEAFEEIESAAAGQWKCTVCGQIFDGDVPPVPCPVCNAGEDAFEQVSAENAEPFRRDTAEQFVLIGGGVASLEAAKAIRTRNATASITMICGEGVVPYNRPGLSDVVGDGVSFINLMLEEYPWYAAQGIRLITDAQARRIDTEDKKVCLSDGSVLSYDKLLLATGANPFNPVKKDENAIPVSTLRTFLDADAIVEQAGGKRVIVVGGGILGVEAAVALRERNSRVTIVELSGRLLQLQADEEASRRLTAALQKQGIEVRCGVSVERATESGALLTDGTAIEADFVLVSIGVRAETGLAREAGITVNRAIAVDEQMRTSADGVFAAGDCAEFEGKAPGQWNVATLQGQTAGAVMAGDEEVRYTAPVPALAFETRGFKLFSAGTVNGENLTEVTAATAGGAYRRLVLKAGRLAGVLMEGDVTGSGKALRLIEKGAKLNEAVELIGSMK